MISIYIIYVISCRILININIDVYFHFTFTFSVWIVTYSNGVGWINIVLPIIEVFIVVVISTTAT